MIKDDKPLDAEPATPAEKKMIFDELKKHVSRNRVLTLDGDSQRGERDDDPCAEEA